MPYQADIDIHVAVYRDERRVFTVTIINIYVMRLRACKSTLLRGLKSPDRSVISVTNVTL